MVRCFHFFGEASSIYYVCENFRKTNISNPQGVKNVSLSEILALYNGWLKCENSHLANLKRFRHSSKPLEGEPCNNN